jgi:hypothetical protein
MYFRLPLAMLILIAPAQSLAQQGMKLVQDGCPVTEEQVKKDAAELGPLLLQGSIEFQLRFTAWYGYHKPRECALQGFMKQLHVVDPEDVRLTVDNPRGAIGFTFQSFPPNSPDPNFKGYEINPWRLVSEISVEQLEQQTKTPSQVSDEINQSIEFTDREVFIKDFRKRKGKLPFDIKQAEDGHLVVYQTDSAPAQSPTPRGTKLVQDGCAVTEEQVKKDAADLGSLLLQGSLEFYRRFNAWYGFQKPRECALQGFMKELHLIDPGDVRLTRGNPILSAGLVIQSFPPESPDPAFKGYQINVWRLISQNSVEELSQHTRTASELSAEIYKSIAPTDREVFVTDFRIRKGNLPFDIKLTDDGDIAVVFTGVR